MYRGKEVMHSETESIIYQMKWYSQTSNTSEVGFTTDLDISEPSASVSLRDMASFILPWYRKSRGTSHYTTIFGV